MADRNRNTWGAKLRRTLTCLLPVSKDRKGQCVHCGACCKLPNACNFIKTDGDGKIYCAVYAIRPLNCRKYPRSKSEHITPDTCGYHFD
jgi:Fe-S-cluster containining protein